MGPIAKIMKINKYSCIFIVKLTVAINNIESIIVRSITTHNMAIHFFLRLKLRDKISQHEAVCQVNRHSPSVSNEQTRFLGLLLVTHVLRY